MEYVAALLPPVGVSLLFWYALRAMMNADRRERQAMARLEKERRKAAGADAEELATPRG